MKQRGLSRQSDAALFLTHAAQDGNWSEQASQMLIWVCSIVSHLVQSESSRRYCFHPLLYHEAFMRIALVIGSTISTIKDASISGRKLLIVRNTDTAGKVTGEPYVAVDTVSAGAGDLVLVTDGSSARYTSQTTNAPVDAVIVGVIDSLELSGKVTYRKE
jgi:microcompartment protein CcmK/EutM